MEARLAPGEVAIKLDSADSRHEKTQRAGKQGLFVFFQSFSPTRGSAHIQIPYMYTTKYFVCKFTINFD